VARLSLGVAATIGAMRPTPAELDVARALIARVKAADPSIKRVDELLVCAAVGRMSGRRAWRRARHATLRSDGGQEQYISRPKQVTDWAARLEKLEQAPASESDSGLLVQPAWIEKNVPDVCWSGKYCWPASVRFTAYSRQTEAGVARALIARLKAAEFLALRGGC
jgi:hypothetical protein